MFKRIKFIAAQVIIFIALLMTISRTPVLSFIIIFAFSVFNYARVRQRLFQIIPLCIIGLCVLAVVIIPKIEVNEQIENRLFDTGTASYERSSHARVRDFVTPFKRAWNKPGIILLGMGPAKDVMRTDSHNEYGWLFQRYGLVGLILYIMLIYKGLKYSLFKYGQARSAEYQILYLSIACAMLNWAIFCMAENILKQIQLMPLNMIALGLIGELEMGSTNEH